MTGERRIKVGVRVVVGEERGEIGGKLGMKEKCCAGKESKIIGKRRKGVVSNEM